MKNTDFQEYSAQALLNLSESEIARQLTIACWKLFRVLKVTLVFHATPIDFTQAGRVNWEAVDQKKGCCCFLYCASIGRLFQHGISGSHSSLQMLQPGSLFSGVLVGSKLYCSGRENQAESQSNDKDHSSNAGEPPKL